MAKYKVNFLINGNIERTYIYTTQKQIVSHAEKIYKSLDCTSVLATDSEGRIWFDQKKDELIKRTSKLD